MTWIETVERESATGRLRELYDRIRGPDGRIDQVLLAHGLRPHTLEGHMALYKSVLHHAGNTLPRWLLEAIGVYVSALNGCAYCVAHHAAGLRRLLADDGRSREIEEALRADRPERAFGGRELAALRYARALTVEPRRLGRGDIDALRAAGLEDGQILEVNQVASYFAYVNRTVLGLGVTTEGDVLGLSPCNAEDAADWSHR